jgi:hypothetical protein
MNHKPRPGGGKTYRSFMLVTRLLVDWFATHGSCSWPPRPADIISTTKRTLCNHHK